MDSPACQVLVVDDYEDLAQLVAELVSDSLGVVTCIARDGDEAVRVAQQAHPKAVIMDLDLPVKDGFQAAREITALCVPPPVVIAVTGRARVQRIEASPFIHLLTKPVDTDQLINELRNPLGL